MKNYLCIAILISAIIFACINSALIKEGCADGIYLWYNSIVPILLPFMLLTGIIISLIRSMRISRHLAFMISLAIGLLCGFPTGTMIITFFYENQTLSKRDAQLLLPLCNNVSPMFLIGYVHSTFIKGTLPLYILIALIYLPQIICTAILYCVSYMRRDHNLCLQPETAATASEIPATLQQPSDQSMLVRCITNITVIGIYMAIFSIISAVLCMYIPGTVTQIATSYLEISNGIQDISTIEVPTKIKTALMISLTSFGGLSAIFQSRDMIRSSGLSFIKYILGKSGCGIICYIITYIYLP